MSTQPVAPTPVVEHPARFTNGYICFDQKGNRHEIYADTQWAAVEKLRAHAKPPKSKQHLCRATLAETQCPVYVHPETGAEDYRSGTPVIHSAVD